MKVYLAARYGRREELCEYRAQLGACGIAVTSRWLDGADQLGPDGKPVGASDVLVESGHSSMLYLASHIARENVKDLAAADTLVCFTERHGEVSRGGRHVDYGFAIGWNAALWYTPGGGPEHPSVKRLMLVGPQESLYYCWPDAEQYPDWPAVRQRLASIACNEPPPPGSASVGRHRRRY